MRSKFVLYVTYFSFFKHNSAIPRRDMRKYMHEDGDNKPAQTSDMLVQSPGAVSIGFNKPI